MDLARELKIKNFRGVFMRDTLPKKCYQTECGVINLDSIKNDGTHWVCYKISKERSIYFDSYGFPPPEELVEYLRKPIEYSNFVVQRLNSGPICGHLCLHVLYQLGRKKSFLDILLNLMKFYDNYNKNASG